MPEELIIGDFGKMDKRRHSLMALFSMGVAGCLTISSTAIAASWTYEGTENWGTLAAEYAACEGQQQSPIDLMTTNTAGVDPVDVNWDPMHLEIVDNGHTIQANAAPGSSTRFGNRHFDLLQVHFHAQSEHTVLGRHFPVEAHFVHKSPEGDLLVLGVMIEEGAPNAALDAIWRGAGGDALAAMPANISGLKDTHLDKTTTHSIAIAASPEGHGALPVEADLTTILPKGHGRFQYAGSLTTPPCSEIVNWVVFSTPVTASAEQIQTFTQRYNANNRPVQHRNRRFVLYGN